MQQRPGLGIDTLISIPEAARLSGVPEATMRRRLKRLQRRLDETGGARVLQRDGKCWVVRLEALRAELRTDVAEHLDERIDGLGERLSFVEDKQQQLLGQFHAERRTQRRRWKAQCKVNDGLRQAVDGLKELADE